MSISSISCIDTCGDRGVDLEGWEVMTSENIEEVRICFDPVKCHIFFSFKLLLDNSASFTLSRMMVWYSRVSRSTRHNIGHFRDGVIKDERCVSKMEGKTNFSRRLNSLMA